MNYPSYVRFVDTHAESNGGTDDLYPVIDEIILCGIACGRTQSGMIDRNMQPVILKHLSYFIRSVPAHAVNDSAFSRMTVDKLKNASDLFFLLIAPFHLQTEVGTVEGRNKHLRISHGQLLYDVLPGYFVCCCSQCDNRYIGKLLAEHFQLCIFRTEIMSPLGNAVSFINGKKRNTDILQQKIQFRKEPFGRDIKEFYPSLHTFETQIGVDRFVVAAVQGTGDDSVGLQTFHLVFHE